MDFPHSHHSHHHRHHDRQEDDNNEERQIYPPPGTSTYPPPFNQPLTTPPYLSPAHHESHAPPPNFMHTPQAQPPYVMHASHAPPPPDVVYNSGAAYRPHAHAHAHVHDSGTVTHHWHHSDEKPMNSSGFVHQHVHYPSGSGFSNKPTFRVYCKAKTDYALSVRHGKVILEPYNPADIFQQWYKDEKYSTRVKDEEGFPCFSLVHKATGLAMKHSVGDTQPVELTPYNPDVLDMSVLWTESKDVSDGYRAVRMVNNISLNVDAYHGDDKHGGVHDGTIIVLWQWKRGDNQLWKITST